MSGPSDSTGSERPCGLSSLLPIGMSCRGKAEAFARSLQSRLRTLGTQVCDNYRITDYSTSVKKQKKTNYHCWFLFFWGAFRITHHW